MAGQRPCGDRRLLGDHVRAVLVSYADTGGAGRAATRLLDALPHAGVDARMVVRSRSTEDGRIVGRRAGPWRALESAGRRLEHAAKQLQRSPNPVVHSPAMAITRVPAQVRALGPDVVNLHWVGDGTLSIGQIGRLEPPVVWTLHDMWAFSGAEHYTAEGADARWRRGYPRGSRPAGHRGVDLDRWTWRRKRRAWSRPFPLVAPSEWMATLARESPLLAGWPVTVIPNPVPVDRYRPRDRDEARRQLGLPTDGRLIVFGALAADRDPRKGWDLLEAALPDVAARHQDAAAVVFGAEAPAIARRWPLAVHWRGYVSDEDVVASHYNAADVVVVPSRQDNLPQTAVEAQASGTPVVAFDTGGLTDTLDDRSTGYLADPFDASDLGRGITWVLEDADRAADMGRRARERAVALWSPSVVARSYVEVYEGAIATQAAGSGGP